MNYSIEGEPLPVVICNLEANETMISKKRKRTDCIRIQFSGIYPCI